MLPWKNLECRRMLEWVICFWKQRNCTWAEIQLFMAKSLFQVESWSNWVIRDSPLHFPAFSGIPALSGLQDGALEKDLEQPGWATEWETYEISARMRFPKESALHGLQKLASRGERALKYWSIDWKTPQNSNHFWVELTSNSCAPIKSTFGKSSTVTSKVKSGN